MSAGIPVRVVHPVPILHRPPRARLPRLGVSAAATEARVVESDPGAYRETLRDEGAWPQRYLADPEGDPWIAVTTDRASGGAPVTRAEFLRWLAGEEAPGDQAGDDLLCLFDRTPLARPGETVAERPSGEILLDLEDLARDGVRSFLERNVRLVGDGVLLRALPLAQAVADGDRLRPVPVPARFLAQETCVASALATLDGLEADAAAYWAPLALSFGPCPRFEAFRAAFPAAGARAIDADEIALALPPVLWDRLDLRERRSARRGEVAIPDATRERLLRWAIGTRFGLMPPEGTAAVLREAATVLDALADADPAPNDFAERALARHVRARVLPRVEAAEVPAADAAALSSLAVDCAPA